MSSWVHIYVMHCLEKENIQQEKLVTHPKIPTIWTTSDSAQDKVYILILLNQKSKTIKLGTLYIKNISVEDGAILISIDQFCVSKKISNMGTLSAILKLGIRYTKNMRHMTTIHHIQHEVIFIFWETMHLLPTKWGLLMYIRPTNATAIFEVFWSDWSILEYWIISRSSVIFRHSDKLLCP